MKTNLSPKDLALAVGVSESSLKRWADDGRLRVIRTAGGHRRIPIHEAIRFARESNLEIVRPDILDLPDLRPARGVRPSQSGNPLEEVLYVKLKDGQSQEVRAMLLDLYLNGRDMAEIFDGPVRVAMQRLGELWRHSDAGIFIEHRATDIVIQSINFLRSLITRPEDPAPRPAARVPAPPVALGGGPTGEASLISSLMICCVLAEAGYRDVNLGPDTPHASFLAAADHYHPRLVWLSCTHPGNAPELEELHQLRDQLRDRGAALVVGGRAFDEAYSGQDHGLDHFTALGPLVDYARRLLADGETRN